jgi:primosomal protein N' (replication factor Y)
MYYKVAVSGLGKVLNVFSSEELLTGERVWLKWRNEKVKGYVLERSFSHENEATLSERDGKSFLSEGHVKIAEWVSERFFSPVGMVFDLFFPQGIDDYKEEVVVSESPFLDFDRMTLRDFLETFGEKTLKEMVKKGLVRVEKNFYVKEPRPRVKKRLFLKKGISEIVREHLTVKQRMVVEYLQFNDGVHLEELLEDLEVSRSVIETLQRKNIVEIVRSDVLPKKRRILRSGFKENISRENLFFGPTGSGKTEALFELIDVYSRKGTVLFLVPEVSVLTHTLSRLKGAFPDLKIGIYHSYLSRARKNLEWYRAVSGKIDVLLGTRSAVFVPVKNLSLLIVDEEHDESFYQYTQPSYDAVVVARKISEVFDVPIILSSATPDLWTYRDAKDGRIKTFNFTRRFGSLSVEVVDMRNEERIGSFAKKTLDRIEETLEEGKRVLIYVRRKGFWGRVQCEVCGHVLKCENCDVSLVYHSDTHSLKCHQCGHEYGFVESCPRCGGRLVGRAAGTERVERELRRYFPTRRIARVDREVVDNIMELESYIDKLIRGEIDILVGTRLITKSLNVPEIGLVCITDVDSLIFNPDYSSSLRTFQLIVQTLGRASRGDQGKAIIQTYNSEDTIIKKALEEDVDGFYAEELERRKALGYPPYRHLVQVAVKSKNPEFGKNSLSSLKEFLKGEEVLGPVEHWVFKLRGFYRYHLIVKTEDLERVLSKLEKALRILGIDAIVRIDPPTLEVSD